MRHRLILEMLREVAIYTETLEALSRFRKNMKFKLIIEFKVAFLIINLIDTLRFYIETLF